MTTDEIKKRLIDNTALFNNIYVIEQEFDILPDNHPHFGAAINYQDLQELRAEFLNQLVDTIVDWIYSSEKFFDLQQRFMASGKTAAAASSEIVRKAAQKFRKSNKHLLIQGQLGELLLFHFIQKIKQAAPLLRKMPITTSADHERYGADAIHFKVQEGKNIIVLGEAKAYTSKYHFSAAFDDAIKSILNTYENYKTELNLYLHEDFLDDKMNQVAEDFLNNRLPNVEIELVSLVLYNETQKLNLLSEEEIRQQIKAIITDRYKNFDNNKIDIETYPILRRITYIVFPVWKFEDIAKEFQQMI